MKLVFIAVDSVEKTRNRGVIYQWMFLSIFYFLEYFKVSFFLFLKQYAVIIENVNEKIKYKYISFRAF